MVAFKMEKFGGEIPAVDDRLLPDNAAAGATNTWVFSGRIEPIHALVPIFTPTKSSTLSWFRLPISDPGIDNMVNSYWLEFDDPLVRVIRSPVAGQDDAGRYYWADGVYPKYATGTMIMQMSAKPRGAWSAATSYATNDGVTSGGNSYTAIADNLNQPPATSPSSWIVTPTPYKLGVPIPETAPGVTSSGGSSTESESRAYVYCWVTSLGELGPPSFPGTNDGIVDATWHITMTAPTAEDMANRNLATTRIFRTVTSAQGVATYWFVDEIPITTLTYDDSFTDAQVVLNEQLTSLYWTEPPPDLEQLVSLPNGMIAGFRNNEVWFCEPYQAHAWPVPYVIAVPQNVVGLGVIGQTVVILTDGSPWGATGVDPSSMALQIIQPLEPCTSRLSIVNLPNGVLYSSPNGLVSITPIGATLITQTTILKDQWNALLHLSSIAASVTMSGYYAYSLTEQGVFQEDTFENDAFQQASFFGGQAGAFISLTDQRVGVHVLNPGGQQVQNVMADIFNGETMVMHDGEVHVVDVRQQTPVAPYTWRSKIWALDYLQNLAAAKIYYTPPMYPNPTATVFRVYAGQQADLEQDGLPLRFEEQLKPSGAMYRLPSGYKALYWQFEVSGVALINSIHVGQSARDLRAV